MGSGPAAAGSALRAHFSRARENAGYGLPPHLFRFKLELASASRGKSDCILLFNLARSFLALKKQSGWEVGRNFFEISCTTSPPIGQAWRLHTARRGRRFGYVAFDRIPNHEITFRRLITSLSDTVPRPRHDVGSRPRNLRR
jgi:hypothetical protein